MANYGQVLDQVLFLLNRQGDPRILDAAQRLTTDRAYFYANEMFFPAERQDTSVILIPGQAYYPLPAGTLSVFYARVNLNGNWIPMTQVDITYILGNDVSTNPPTTSPPNYFAIQGGKIRLYPRPDQVYQLELSVEAQILPPRLSTDSNFWTNEGFTLIVESTCEDIARLYLNDEPRAQRHGAAAQRELQMLRGATNRLIGPIKIQGYL